MERAVSSEALRELSELGVATCFEASGARGAMDPAIHPMWNGARVCGPAYTARCQGRDNLAIHRSIEFLSSGEILVVAVGGLLAGYWGGILTLAAQVKGAAGLVIDGGIRDSEEIAESGFPVFARGTGLFRCVKNEPGDLQVPISCGGALVRPGDIILGDGDGVIVIAPERIDEVLAASRKRDAAEKEYMDRIRKGELTMDIYGLRH